MQQRGMVMSKEERKKRFFGVLPLIATPFVILMLWSFGVVGNGDANVHGVAYKGLNTLLPSAAPSGDSSWNKMNYYEQADQDSAKRRSMMKQDPFFKNKLDNGFSDSANNKLPFHYDPYPGNAKVKKDPHVEKVYQKLGELNKQLAANETREKAKSDSLKNPDPSIGVKSHDIDRIENMMQSMNQPREKDPEMEQMKDLLDRISDIQHPQAAEEKLRLMSEKNKRAAYPVSLPQDNPVSLLQTPDSAGKYLHGGNAFYSLDDAGYGLETASENILATIQETQTLVSGETVALRLKQDIFIHGMLIPANQFLFGKAELKADRLEINISSVQFQNHVLPVSLAVYAMDGMEGIPIQDAMTRDVAVNSGNQALQSVGLSNMDQSFGAQAGTAAVTAAKTLIGHKAKLVKVTLKAGYDVLLVDKQQINK